MDEKEPVGALAAKIAEERMEELAKTKEKALVECANCGLKINKKGAYVFGDDIFCSFNCLRVHDKKAIQR